MEGREHYWDDDAHIAEKLSDGCVAASNNPCLVYSSRTSPSAGETASLHPAQVTGGHGSG